MKYYISIQNNSLQLIKYMKSIHKHSAVLKIKALRNVSEIYFIK